MRNTFKYSYTKCSLYKIWVQNNLCLQTHDYSATFPHLVVIYKKGSGKKFEKYYSIVTAILEVSITMGQATQMI